LHSARWAWWGLLLLFGLGLVSVVVTITPMNFQDIVTVLDLPPLEAEAMSGIPLSGWHISLFISLPILATIYLAYNIRSDFLPRRKPNDTP
jgi:hypothetical protein